MNVKYQSKREQLQKLLERNNGYLKTSEALDLGISRTTVSHFVHEKKLERVVNGLYLSSDEWEDPFYILQMRYPSAIFSHETALYLLGRAEREPLKYSLTLEAGKSSTVLVKEGIKVYKIKKELFDIGQVEVKTPFGNSVRSYDLERTLCDLFRSRRTIESQTLQMAMKEYMRSDSRNIPQLMRLAKQFSIDKIISPYVEALLS